MLGILSIFFRFLKPLSFYISVLGVIDKLKMNVLSTTCKIQIAMLML